MNTATTKPEMNVRAAIEVIAAESPNLPTQLDAFRQLRLIENRRDEQVILEVSFPKLTLVFADGRRVEPDVSVVGDFGTIGGVS